jgi:Holliday junction resolvase
MRPNAPNARPAVRAPMGGRRSRDKGARAERALVRFLQERGFAAQRVPLSGSAGGRFAGDITIPLFGVDRIAEVKVRDSGFRLRQGAYRP